MIRKLLQRPFQNSTVKPRQWLAIALIILVGMYHRMEIWNPSEWRRFIARTEDRYEQNMARIHKLL